jgi:ketosteroid isomerase-like protein
MGDVVDSADVQHRLAALEERVKRLEDQLAIHRLINSWGPAVDTGNGDAAAALWADDGILESDLSYLIGPASIKAMVHGEGHQALIRNGSAHIPAFPIVSVDGDEASATGYTRVYHHTGEGYEVWRLSANRWEFRRTADGWRVTKRITQVIDGGEKANEILSRALDQPS